MNKRGLLERIVEELGRPGLSEYERGFVAGAKAAARACSVELRRTGQRIVLDSNVSDYLEQLAATWEGR